jgi:hypothetical protein
MCPRRLKRRAPIPELPEGDIGYEESMLSNRCPAILPILPVCSGRQAVILQAVRVFPAMLPYYYNANIPQIAPYFYVFFWNPSLKKRIPHLGHSSEEGVSQMGAASERLLQ